METSNDYALKKKLGKRSEKEDALRMMITVSSSSEEKVVLETSADEISSLRCNHLC